jgi:hypothetical protein
LRGDAVREAVNDLVVAGGHDVRDVHSERFGPTGG